MIRRHLALAVLASLVLATTARAGEATAKKPYFDSNGVKIHYIVEGSEAGEPVVLIHGFTSSIDANWAPVIAALRKDYKIIAMDCRGHGGSDKPHDPKKYGLDMVEDVVRLLDHLKIKKAHIAGYSMGAGIALQMAARHPDRVRTTILGGNGMPSPESTPFFLAIADSLEKGKGFGPLIHVLTPKGRPQPTEKQVKAINDAILAHNDPLALAAVMRGLASKDLSLSEETIKGIKMPMIALIGEIDPLRIRVDELKQRRPDLQVVVIPGADHVTPLTRDEFVNGIKTFLDKHRTGN